MDVEEELWTCTVADRAASLDYHAKLWAVAEAAEDIVDAVDPWAAGDDLPRLKAALADLRES